ncbi:MAG: NAD(P)-dependent oxidoreductase [Desulfobacter postgatei]|uniref:NAD dependent epimerase/dehydratase family protein n=1 Tax=Desulfobacter postgatei 2ac9 TaxID=879212 RepID=I5B6J4_9BACT|nr:NAD(P)-dependent oxidoreductase [Desulfobacter postgatei]EIM65107.1 NAD dependent epimerase/dehydratase family protein [Desulfobacter postgatei 2ac9]MDD4274320.1 NAD(P)-dependent oxidoreductase [Desulfobacter postgatei]
MDTAIVTGATGLVGSAVVRKLLENNIDVLCIGRKEPLIQPRKNLPGTATNLKMDMADILSLEDKIGEIGWVPGFFCVFYHFSWKGLNALTDGSVDDQLKNVTYSANALVSAQKIGCKKFVNAGTIEETFAEKYLDNRWQHETYPSGQNAYAASKLAARDMCVLLGYLNKIDYVHTRLSVPFNPSFTGKGYISSAIRAILAGEAYAAPTNPQLLDLTHIKDVAQAYYLVGQKGKNKANYFIGSGEPKKLSQYFGMAEKKAHAAKSCADAHQPCTDNLLLTAEDFSIDDLKRDTGFVLKKTFDDLVEEMEIK